MKTAFETFKEQCLKDADVIFARVVVNGRLGNYPLSKCSKEQQDEFIRDWWNRKQTTEYKSAFTLMEMLIVISIIAILAGLTLMAMRGIEQNTRADRTRSIITKIDTLIQEKWESLRTRAVPLRLTLLPQQIPDYPRTAAMQRLDGIHEIMRTELPDRIADVRTALITLNAAPSVWRAYNRRAKSTWTEEYEGAECLYLILSMMRDGDKTALDFLLTEEVGDVDEDGMKEILDGWGRPIQFIRWPAGYVKESGAITLQSSNYKEAPDSFDPIHVDLHWPHIIGRNPDGTPIVTQGTGTFELHPLIVSSGRDGHFDLQFYQGLSVPMSNPFFGLPYLITDYPNDPYFGFSDRQLGDVGDIDGDGEEEWADNITNHWRDK